MVRPKKHLGQHFLNDENIARKIAATLPENTYDVLEIGPGTGILSKYLLANNFRNYMAIEVDMESIEYLNRHFPEMKEKIIFGDFLKYDLASVFHEEFSIIGNFPYNISSQILFKVLEYKNQIPFLVGMFQKEVAERIASPPGSKKYGILSVLVQAYYHIEYLFTVSEHVFSPPPKVKSAVIRLQRNNVDKLDCDEKRFVMLVKTAFNQRRKTIRNALKKYTFSPEAQFLLGQRAEQLSVEEFVFLVNQLVVPE